MTAEVSHGRGGAGNINADETRYVDGEIVRSGAEGSHEDGPYSTGRGGTGNIGDADARPSLERADRTVVPEAAVRPSADLSDYHTGRGGAGNEHLAPMNETPAAAGTTGTTGPETHNIGLADKLKNKIFGAFKK
ncbi:hypothetical protein CMQ_7785 [Grosmannia clavigera kw1407]|uniref:Uncharacterized protein n=1 Tax=Grosmannia clavigera (strain kw1407 / UAMH 11150) TaxID=655863 RepID=F0XRY1_GROCL|nr:uncharacterized protein CMQ_7785 [Grosmannia clavigera kw1407]EFW99417.1 hypothetical protein CMQ_7785 [Grosmannia clavigera kw1407]